MGGRFKSLGTCSNAIGGVFKSKNECACKYGTWQVGLYKPREVWAGGKPSQWFATEELAELYVVIQAIEF